MAKPIACALLAPPRDREGLHVQGHSPALMSGEWPDVSHVLWRVAPMVPVSVQTQLQITEVPGERAVSQTARPVWGSGWQTQCLRPSPSLYTLHLVLIHKLQLKPHRMA